MTAPTTPQKIKLVCPVCGSDRILADAYAYWDTETQLWDLHAVYDYTICDDCGIEVKDPKEIPI